jgi:hypothetical protein
VFGREIDLLRTVALNLVSTTTPAGLDQVAIRPPGREAFIALSDSISGRFPAMERGTSFASVQTELFNILANRYVSRDPATINATDVSSLHAHFEQWYDASAKPRSVFVPCFLTRWAAPRFSIGPVVFIFVEEFAQSEFYPQSDGGRGEIARQGFDQMLTLMRDSRSHWLACVRIEGCERDRAQDIGALAVDLAIVAVQLAAPAFDTRTMARLDARRGTVDKFTLSEADGGYSYSSSTVEPGLSIGPGALTDILNKSEPIMTAVGNRVGSFATGRFRLLALERSWCDAAYWLHQALAEPLDSISVAMLETALEVLLSATNRPGSEKRLLAILEIFFGLRPQDPIAPGATTTAKRFAKNFVSERSQILHGSWSTLNSRSTLNRDMLENFVIRAIRQAALELEGYVHSASPKDDVDAFLAWVESRKVERRGEI